MAEAKHRPERLLATLEIEGSQVMVTGVYRLDPEALERQQAQLREQIRLYEAEQALPPEEIAARLRQIFREG